MTARQAAISAIATHRVAKTQDYLKDAGAVIYGSYVFNEGAQQKYLAKPIYRKLRQTIDGLGPLDPEIVDAVAHGVKEWALAHGATHYTHWFVPMTGSTAEKHDSFLTPTGDGQTIAAFSGQNLLQGEPDASSFPSGGLRATFEARGYTGWDVTSPIFLQVEPNGVTMTIPTAYVSFTGEALDFKIPLLRSQEALGVQALRVLRWFDNTTAERVITNIGPEQEYFLIDRRLAEQRPDLLLTGRTLFGAPSPKGQELEDQYFGPIRERILAFMMDLDRELWRLGIPAKTRHNEVAPAQFEMAPVYEATSVGSDHNMIVMSHMRRLASQHGLMLLIHEKPFAGINGSGKHNNWSMATDGGENLLDPGNDPHANAQFLAFLVAVIRAVNVHADLLRAAIADAGNDHRLGANEAPPAIVSIFLGEQLEDVIAQLEQGPAAASKKGGELRLGATSLPVLAKDATDRNRTSPFAFTGNKFEFRAVGSSAPIYWPQTVLNTAVADSLKQLADELDKLDHGDFVSLTTILSTIIKANKQVLFEGNGYSEAWHAEAARRHLPNNRTTVDALPALTTTTAKALFSSFGVLSERELASRVEINWERYVKIQDIEASTAMDIASTMILPATARYLGQLAGASSSRGISAVSERVSGLADALVDRIAALERAQHAAHKARSVQAEAKAFATEVIPAQEALRAVVDELETLVADDLWPLPKYREMLFQY
ncbi:MAG: glutamine synthetase type III [Thermomicrobiales bacterium]|nr:MAG: glutamine synthetase type III [Thermomicrobiales bacterium]